MGIPLRSNFAYAFVLLPRARRRALEAVYTFCREVDDAVDGLDDTARHCDPSSPAKGAEVSEVLRGFRQQLAQIYRGEPTRKLDLFNAVRHYELKENDFIDVILGVEMDLTTTRYETFDALYTYCYRVASAVGMLSVSIFGVPEARHYAEKLGVALQLTNILRDVREDAMRGRIYLPLEDLRRYGVAESTLLEGRYSRDLVALLRAQAERAERYYKEAHAALPRAKRDQLSAAVAMGCIYHALLHKIVRRRFNVFDSRITLSPLTKARLALTAGLYCRLPAGLTTSQTTR